MWGALQPGSDDAIADALEDAATSSALPWRPSVPLPLPEIEWAVTVNDGDLSKGQTWPPTRFAARQERLQLFHELWRGDVSRLIDTRQLANASVGPVNAFRRLSKFVADLLVREVPTVGDTDGALSDAQLMRIVHAAATQATKSGVGYLLFATTSAGPMIRGLDTRHVYRLTSGGWLIVEPRIAPGSAGSIPNALQVINVDTDHNATVLVVSGTPTGIGDQITVGPVTAMSALGEVMIVPVLSLPEIAENIIGLSWYEDIITIVIQKARRMGANTKVLDENSDPLMLLRGNLDNYTTLPGVPPSVAVQSPGEMRRQAAIAKRLRQAGPLVVPDGIESAEYVTWTGDLEASMMMLERLDKDFQFLSGLMAALTAETQVPSGMSLRRLFWQFDASVAPLYHGLHSAIVGGMALYDKQLKWSNIFEAVEDSPVMSEREDVSDESTARRGEGSDNPNG